MKLIVSFGGGVNSAAMLVGMHERAICPDAILFADTGGEKPETYAFVETMRAWTLAHMGLDIATVQNDGKYVTLENECRETHTLPSIVFGFRSCSDKYKVRPQHKYAKQFFPREGILWAIGIDAGEPHRTGNFESSRMFLIDWGWDREACISALVRAGLPVPVKSACFYCPSSKKHEILSLKKDHPDLFYKAVAMEKNTTGLTDIVGLGRSWSWEKMAAIDESQLKMFPEAQSMPCMCFDGEE